jgi:hypothetical protein
MTRAESRAEPSYCYTYPVMLRDKRPQHLLEVIADKGGIKD